MTTEPPEDDALATTLELLRTRAKRLGCNCEAPVVTWEQVSDGDAMLWRLPAVRAAILASGPNGIYIDHEPWCLVRRIGTATWN